LVGHRTGRNGRLPRWRSFPHFLLACLPHDERKRNKEQSMDVVYVLLELAFFAVSYAFVELIMRL
jgi:hypothetical protein